MPRETVAKYEGAKKHMAGFKVAPPAGKKPAKGVLARGNDRRMKAKVRKNAAY